MSDAEATPTLGDLEEIIEAGDAKVLEEHLDSLPPGEAGLALTRLEPEAQTELLTLLNAEDASQLLDALPEEQAAQILAELPVPAAAAICDELFSDEKTDLLARLDSEDAEAILDQMNAEEAADVRMLSQFEPDEAGGLMITEFLAYREDDDVEAVLQDMRDNAQQYAEYDVQYAYVLSQEGRLVGVLRLRDLLLSKRHAVLKSLMIPSPTSLPATTGVEDLRKFFGAHAWFGVPVTDQEQRLLGVVRRQDVEEAATEQASQTFLKFAGIVGGEELRSLPLRSRSARRLSWLSVNILLNVAAASIIAWHQETLQRVIALAVFLPIISDMSGCSGSQAVAVSMRELTLGLLKPYEFLRVFVKESQVGIINGLALGALLGGVAWLWKSDPMLGAVVGGALGMNTLVAVVIGGTIPLFLRSLKLDPALASGPMLTTVTDMCGFFLVLSFAEWSGL